jgi:hypothetical protein
MFAGIGGLGLVLGADYSTGSLDAIGPGFLPRLLSWSLVALGVIIAVADLRKSETGPPEGGPHVRIVCVTAGIVAFAVLIDPFGLLIAGGTLLVIGACASQEFRWREVMALAATLLLFAWALFVAALGLPIPTWPR